MCVISLKGHKVGDMIPVDLETHTFEIHMADGKKVFFLKKRDKVRLFSTFRETPDEFYVMKNNEPISGSGTAYFKAEDGGGIDEAVYFNAAQISYQKLILSEKRPYFIKITRARRFWNTGWEWEIIEAIGSN